MFEPIVFRCVGARNAGREIGVENTIAIHLLRENSNKTEIISGKSRTNVKQCAEMN